MSLPARYDIRFGKGEAWSEVFLLEDEATPPNPIDLTGRDVSAVIAATRDTAELELVDGAGLDVTPTTGRVAINLTGDQTRPMRGTTWTLWLDKDTPTADILVTGNVYVIGG